ncbi:hypothetical protein HK099_002519 [Clydaea vesicula]|uniref:Uncharacterized protein n=1 Tax=Clydaea vesicula TaxID=447962 RepID=A0AAD5U5U7_9FUNG|nr:hypothetical protein HK099_002519 [Clydaea vesicula]
MKLCITFLLSVVVAKQLKIDLLNPPSWARNWNSIDQLNKINLLEETATRLNDLISSNTYNSLYTDLVNAEIISYDKSLDFSLAFHIIHDNVFLLVDFSDCKTFKEEKKNDFDFKLNNSSDILNQYLSKKSDYIYLSNYTTLTASKNINSCLNSCVSDVIKHLNIWEEENYSEGRLILFSPVAIDECSLIYMSNNGLLFFEDHYNYRANFKNLDSEKIFVSNVKNITFLLGKFNNEKELDSGFKVFKLKKTLCYSDELNKMFSSLNSSLIEIDEKCKNFFFMVNLFQYVHLFKEIFWDLSWPNLQNLFSANVPNSPLAENFTTATCRTWNEVKFKDQQLILPYINTGESANPTVKNIYDFFKIALKIIISNPLQNSSSLVNINEETINVISDYCVACGERFPSASYYELFNAVKKVTVYECKETLISGLGKRIENLKADALSKLKNLKQSLPQLSPSNVVKRSLPGRKLQFGEAEKEKFFYFPKCAVGDLLQINVTELKLDENLKAMLTKYPLKGGDSLQMQVKVNLVPSANLINLFDFDEIENKTFIGEELESFIEFVSLPDNSNDYFNTTDDSFFIHLLKLKKPLFGEVRLHFEILKDSTLYKKYPFLNAVFENFSLAKKLKFNSVFYCGNIPNIKQPLFEYSDNRFYAAPAEQRTTPANLINFFKNYYTSKIEDHAFKWTKIFDLKNSNSEEFPIKYNVLFWNFEGLTSPYGIETLKILIPESGLALITAPVETAPIFVEINSEFFSIAQDCKTNDNADDEALKKLFIFRKDLYEMIENCPFNDPLDTDEEGFNFKEYADRYNIIIPAVYLLRKTSNGETV